MPTPPAPPVPPAPAPASTRPTLIVVSGPPGAGKTTLAHAIARAVGCPAVCRDEIKEGMVHATPGHVPGPADELNTRTLPAFFGVLELLLRAGVTTVAEAAYQDRLWRPGLTPLLATADVRVVHCTVRAGVALERTRLRLAANPVRRAHEEGPQEDAAAHAVRHDGFHRVALDVPWIEVDTTDGYAPGLDEIVAFAGGPRRPASGAPFTRPPTHPPPRRSPRVPPRDKPDGTGGSWPADGRATSSPPWLRFPAHGAADGGAG